MAEYGKREHPTFYYAFMGAILAPVILIFASIVYDILFNGGAFFVVNLFGLGLYVVLVFGCGVRYNRRGINPAARGPLDDTDR
ncbi:MAG: hypothetical protein C4K47_01845 [Candidatus Thorarchaeota archaeon]|nr:MAG: hypothetical protein C4K47_01845 [Candidatus Thorarchaeota archaeon]